MNDTVEAEVVEGTALEVHKPGALELKPKSVEQMIHRVGEIKRLADAVMVEDTHYGKIPGVKNASLWLAGAEVLDVTFEISPVYDDDLVWRDGGHLVVFSTCTMVHQGAGMSLAQATGVCSTLEPKYRWRESKPTCPKCGAETIFKSKYPPRDRPREKPGWFCWANKGGCGTEFPATHDFGSKGQVERDPAEQYNTVMAMAQKRAHIRATRNSTGASMVFTDSLPGDPGEQAAEPYANQGPPPATIPGPPPGWDSGPPEQEPPPAPPPQDSGVPAAPPGSDTAAGAGRAPSAADKARQAEAKLRLLLADIATQPDGAEYVKRIIAKANTKDAVMLGDDRMKGERSRLYARLGARWKKDELDQACLTWFDTDWSAIPEKAVPYVEIFFGMVPLTALDKGLGVKG